MILVADSGSTKTDWRAIDASGAVRGFSSAGINPVLMSPAEISQLVSDKLLPALGSDVDEVWFYGAGVMSDEMASVVSGAISGVFPKARCFAGSDMLGAARSLCGDDPGIVCIIGTGSNSCRYDGREITGNVRSGGYILGDEASGAWFGRKFLSDFVKGLLPQAIEREFDARFGLDYPSLVQKVYREPMPNRYMASFLPFLGEFTNHPYVRSLIRSGFDEFLSRNVAQYDNSRFCPVSFTGSVAFYFKDILLKALSAAGMTAGRIVRAPMDGLIRYHSGRI